MGSDRLHTTSIFSQIQLSCLVQSCFGILDARIHETRLTLPRFTGACIDYQLKRSPVIGHFNKWRRKNEIQGALGSVYCTGPHGTNFVTVRWSLPLSLCVCGCVHGGVGTCARCVTIRHFR